MAETPQQERTEEPTPHRRKEAREQGQVALSQDLVAALSLAAAAGALVLGGGALARDAGILLRAAVDGAPELARSDLDVSAWGTLVAASARPIAMQTALVMSVLLVAGLGAAYAQVGFQVTPKALELNFERLSPASGWKRLTGSRSAARTLLAAVKIALVGGAAGWMAWSRVASLAAITSAPLGIVLTGVGDFLVHVVGAALGTFVLLAVLDTLYQRWQHTRDLRMTREELKQELKNTDGDPRIRAKIREIQRRMARSRMMADVPTATVVVTNPTHVAVALRWSQDELQGEHGADRSGSRAPVVVAKGADLMAQRIKEIAREHGVPLHEDVPLARALHARCEIGQEISTDLYEAVAAVLAHVWKLGPEHAQRS
jgi:flagellar biosynthetic protein FlhB